MFKVSQEKVLILFHRSDSGFASTIRWLASGLTLIVGLGFAPYQLSADKNLGLAVQIVVK